MDYLQKVVTLENKIRRHCERGYWSRLVRGGQLRYAYLEIRYMQLTGSFLSIFGEASPFVPYPVPDDELIQKTAMPRYAQDRLRTSEMIANSHEFRNIEFSELPKTYLVDVCHDLKRVIKMRMDDERLKFLLERLQYELLSRK